MEILRTKRVIIIAAAIGIFLVLLLVIVLPSSPKKAAVKPKAPSVTPTGAAPQEQADVPVPQATTAQEALLDRFEHRQPLSSDDVRASDRLLALLPPDEKSGTLVKTPNFMVDYVSSADLFQVEILTTDIDQAKAEAVLWFTSQGMSQQGICRYPVQFYLNFEVGKKIGDAAAASFSPLAPGC